MPRTRIVNAIILGMLAMLWGCAGSGGGVSGAPALTAITPSTVAAGGPEFTLSVAGSGFGNAVVTWNGQALATTVVSSSQLTAQVPAGLIANPGVASIAAVNLPFAGSVSSNSLPLTIGQPSTLSISKTHSGNFTQGQSHATYTIVVRNGAGGGSTNGTITVKDTLPAGLTPAGISGSGWTCDPASLTCTRSDSLPPSSSFAPITVAVNVAAGASGTVTNSATLSGGGSSGATANDITTINPPAVPALSISKTHNGNFTQGQAGATYSITIHNGGTGATNGAVSVVDTLPAGLTATNMAGSGWTCDNATLTCTRADALAPGGTYPAITLTVDVAATAPASVVNSVSVSGGGSPSSSANDPTTINPPVPLPPPAAKPALKISKSHSGNFNVGQIGATYTIAVTNNGNGPTSGAVTVTDTLPAGLSEASMAGPGWTCDNNTLTCIRGDALPAGSGYPPITLTVNVTAAAPATVTNNAAVSGGGSANDSTSDSTNIVGP